MAGDFAASADAVNETRALLPCVDVDHIRARVLQRLGVAIMYSGDRDSARDVLVEAADLATELDMHSLASRAYTSLSVLMLHSYDDVLRQLAYANRSLAAAEKAGDPFDVQNSLLQVVAAETRLGNGTASDAAEQRLIRMFDGDESRMHYLTAAKALRLAWEGRVSEAHRMLAPCCSKMHHPTDRLVSGAQCALFMSLDGQRDAAVAMTDRTLKLRQDLSGSGPFFLRSVALAELCCALAEASNGRTTRADRICKKLKAEDSMNDNIVATAWLIVDEICAASAGRLEPRIEFLNPLLTQLSVAGYAYMSRILEALLGNLSDKRNQAEMVSLTPTEVFALRMLDRGLSPKQIADRKGCSVHTVRNHVANAIGKLRCSGRAEAVAIARGMGLLA